MNEMGQWQTRDSFMSLLRKNGIQIRIRLPILPMAEGFIARHIEIGGRKHTENRMIIRGLDMTARGTRRQDQWEMHTFKAFFAVKERCARI
jgi:hypothetical protein